jgi:uncharacterized membrane protein
MLELIAQRLRSKTYWVAIIGALLAIADVQSGFLTGFLPVQYRAYAVMLWPILMLTLREVTTTALSDK